VKEFRRCLGKFATGVAVVTCSDDRGNPRGMTANSFSSVSLEPRLVLWNIAKVSNSLEAYLAAGSFAINILASDQQDLSAHFARSDHTLFDAIDIDWSADDVPLIPGALACFECRTHAIHDTGDHHIIIGEVVRFEATNGDPLMFFGGDYAAIA